MKEISNFFNKRKHFLSNIILDTFFMVAIYFSLKEFLKIDYTSIIVHEGYTYVKVVFVFFVEFIFRLMFGVYEENISKINLSSSIHMLIADLASFICSYVVGVLYRNISLGLGVTAIICMMLFVSSITTRYILLLIDRFNQRKVSKKIQFSPPDISDEEINEVVDALKSGWITTGPRTKQFEKNIAKFVGVNKCVCLNSQTACAEISLRLLGIGPGDEVITTAYTYTASASVIEHVGAKIVLVDCKKDSFEIDYDQIEAKITNKTKAIIPVDLGGVPCDYDRLFEIVEIKKSLFTPSDNDIQKALGRIAICSDMAHSFGASYKGRMCGSIADFSSSSFHAVKNLTTAEGGCLFWRPVNGISDDEIYSRIQLLSLHGQNKDALSKTKVGAWEYDIIGTYYKCNMTDVVAAIGLKQLERYPKLLKRRDVINTTYDEGLRDLGLDIIKHHSNQYISTGHLYLVRIPGIEETERNEIITKMAEAGIVTNVHYKPLPMFTAYKKLGFDIKDYPNAYNRYCNLISLPNHTLLTNKDLKFIINTFRGIVKEYI